MIDIVPATESHIIELRKNLRPEDEREIKNFGLCVRKILWTTFHETRHPMAVLVDGKIAGVFGCAGTIIGEIGRPWMLATPIADKYPLQFALLYRQEIKKMLKLYPVLENVVDATYHKAIKLMEIMGFEVYNAEPMGPRKAMFCRFRMTQ